MLRKHLENAEAVCFSIKISPGLIKKGCLEACEAIPHFCLIQKVSPPPFFLKQKDDNFPCSKGAIKSLYLAPLAVAITRGGGNPVEEGPLERI